MYRKKLCKLTTFRKKIILNEVGFIYSFKTIYSQTTTTFFRKLSILPIQLINRGTFSSIGRFLIEIKMMHVKNKDLHTSELEIRG